MDGRNEDRLVSFKAKYKRFLKDGSGDPCPKSGGRKTLINLTFAVEETKVLLSYSEPL